MTSTKSLPTEGFSALQAKPEDRLLMECARMSLNEAHRSNLLNLCRLDLNWTEVLESAAWHKLDGFLFRHLTTDGIKDAVPDAVRAHLSDKYKYQFAKQMYFRRELRDILRLLDEAAIPVILLKGAALIDEVYGGDLGLRPMSDLDLLVRPEQSQDADTLLRQQGFRPGVDEETQERMRQVDRQLAALARPGSPVVVEIHTHLVPADSPIRFEIGRLWDDVRYLNVEGVEAGTLGPEALLVSLSVNYLKDRRYYSYSALGQLCDVAEVLRKYQAVLDWSQFETAGRFGNLRGVMFGTLYSAKQLLEAPVPSSVLEDLTPKGFNPAVAVNLIRDRVLGREWVAKNLSGGQTESRSWTLPFRMARRIFLSRDQFEYRRSSSSRGTLREYIAANVSRFWDAAKLAGRFVMQPRKLQEDVNVDRWLNSLYRTSE